MPSITLARPAIPSIAGRASKALGTFCSVLVTEPTALGSAGHILSGHLAAIDLACSRFRPDSELSTLNRSTGQRHIVSPLFADALSAALLAAEMTDGDVDPTCGACMERLGYDKDFAELAADKSTLTEPPVAAPGWRCVEFDAARLSVRVPPGVVLDLGATAKAFAADTAAQEIVEQIGCGVLVNLGGDIAIAGAAPPGGWRIDVDDGTGSFAEQRCVAIEAGGIATSCPAVRRWRRFQVIGNGVTGNDRVAPRIQRDELRQELSAQAMRLARDWIDAQPVTHHGPAFPGIGSKGGSLTP
jgi:thiamine biosynthesis lipoprotein